MSNSTTNSPADVRRRCIVIGGGLAGLASAVWLAEAGQRVTLLERRGSLGGRTVAMPVSAMDDVPDNGQHVFASGYEHLFRYLESVGTRNLVAFPGHMTVREPGGRTRRSSFSGIAGARTAFGDLAGVPLRDRPATALAQARLIKDVLRQPADLDTITADEWFRRIGLPASARASLWDGIVIGLTGDKTTITSAKVPADLLRTGLRQAIRHRTPISIGYPTVDLDTLFIDGAEKVFADHGVEIETRCVAKTIEVADGKVVGVRLNDGTLLESDAVICAVPVWSLGDLLVQLPENDRIKATVDALTPVPIVSVNLYLDRSIGMTDWGEILLGGEGVLEQVWDRQLMHGRDTERGWLYSTTVSAAYELVEQTPNDITELQMATLRQYYPEAADAQVVHSHVVKMPRATFAQRPGTAGIRPDQRTSVTGLALAGDWTRTDWTTTMEGACQSAARAVDVILGQA
ncbi:FAD-dependent oxidoreductase [Antrihabitans sp. YC2-6]|uniref:hydroxysqualene dehydroxylase n=1 Tax=Antrihabitans sp. YC2-6 TaxID=2799498 RepID=UPI0018F5F970|nr:FAD-dependent oxidoreductase [Antrihabitans sp. YC2-6]MBJ8348820.1 FAD-dependent oxidoreductase [Antrihabitans sp. YC2-6]